MDCHGSDIFYFHSVDPNECCANCSATPACNAWTFTGLSHFGVGPQYCCIKSDCNGYATEVGHISGYPPAVMTPLTRLGSEALAGSNFTGYRIRYSTGTTAVWVSFKLYPSSALLAFEQEYPDGLTGVNITHAVNSSASGLYTHLSAHSVCCSSHTFQIVRSCACRVRGVLRLYATCDAVPLVCWLEFDGIYLSRPYHLVKPFLSCKHGAQLWR